MHNKPDYRGSGGATPDGAACGALPKACFELTIEADQGHPHALIFALPHEPAAEPCRYRRGLQVMMKAEVTLVERATPRPERE